MAAVDVDLGELQDVSQSEAYQVLNNLVEQYEIPVEKADKAKKLYARLHNVLFEAMTRERGLLDEAKGYKRELDRLEGHAGMEEDGETLIETLREDVDSALAEASLAQERQQLLQLEVTDLQRQRNEIAARVEELAAEQAEALGPMIATLQEEVFTLSVEAETEQERLINAKSELSTTKDRLTQVTADIERLIEVKATEKTALFKAEQLPEKAHRQSEAVAGVLKNVRGQLETALERLAEVEAQYVDRIEQERAMQEEHSRVLNAVTRGRMQIESKERHADDVRKNLEMACIEADKVLADQVELDLQINNAIAQIKIERDLLARRVRDKETALRQYKAVEAVLKSSTEDLPNLKYQIEQLVRDNQGVATKIQSQRKETAEVKRDLDINMNSFLAEEAVGKDKAVMFQLTFKQVSLMEEELEQLKKEEGIRNKILLDLGSQRDRVALSIANKLAKVKEVEAQGRIKDLDVLELKKIRKDISRRIRDYEKLYNLVKNQRNKFVNLIQAANQSTTEMKDKSKVLNNETEILHSEVMTKDKLLGQSRSQHSSALSERDQLRIELGKLGAIFRVKQDVVDEQIADVDKLNAIINQTEKAMLKLRKQYEIAIESRNYTGIMLIDRNDELCILYEKCNIQEEVLKGGVLELHLRDDEERVLRIEVAELQRSIAATMKIVPQIPLLDEDVARLQKALLESRRESETLSLALENPGNQSRWRLLEGKIPDKEELGAKIQQLEERLNDKKESLLEKELILEEITGLSDKLRAQASDGRSDTLELARRVNDYQSRLRTVTRKVMAIVSELSMYQAQSLKLGAEREELEEEVKAADERLSAGLPPTEDCEREWYRLERTRMLQAELDKLREEDKKGVDAKDADAPTTAEARPNAYIPESLGIPKPYGNFAPFKPSEPGSTMRHIRNPQPKEIVI
ncbi:hypothetical protein CEUSTIGMA_g6943.t1 [Chlamydomonas eustigma]|uniref:Cilia- and flagella-associated protein 58 central coiled coil domain-containing protein n=1 Tax=Chlamydomonas eustigma TaxID=1157962 RepID=A0A250X9D0_9CHLO|nr:hypothetical protein CEUSTIGMA_g6943.t1 [Chlamydomonas eustigma]|eukprot:GAX79502.1 hypothetical protein CEUSTIGMA_g6943.t1 [Chlamydomonas eustigma]